MIDAVTIRMAVPQDLAALDMLFARAYPKLLRADYPPSVMVTAVPLLAKAQPRLLASRTFFVAQGETGALIGAGGWTPARQAGLGEVRHVVTDDRYTRRGIGRTLFETIFESAKAAGIHQMECLATYTAVPFYEAVGFHRVEATKMPLRPGIVFPAVRMVRPL